MLKYRTNKLRRAIWKNWVHKASNCIAHNTKSLMNPSIAKPSNL
uniref:Uncharacterized protein n=1 Tax=Anguilla anguilla TaxID=7936 RepID=A0A0E9TJZ6_ANGAN